MEHCWKSQETPTRLAWHFIIAPIEVTWIGENFIAIWITWTSFIKLQSAGNDHNFVLCVFFFKGLGQYPKLEAACHTAAGSGWCSPWSWPAMGLQGVMWESGLFFWTRGWPIHSSWFQNWHHRYRCPWAPQFHLGKTKTFVLYLYILGHQYYTTVQNLKRLPFNDRGAWPQIIIWIPGCFSNFRWALIASIENWNCKTEHIKKELLRFISLPVFSKLHCHCQSSDGHSWE